MIHCPSVVGGNAPSLSFALNDIGTPSISVALEGHNFGYSPDVVLWKSSYGLFKREFTRIIAVWRVVLGYKTIHYNFGTTMASPSMPLLLSETNIFLFLLRRIHFYYSEGLQVFEILLIRICKRRVIITYQGDDARQGDFSLNHYEESIAHHVGQDYYNQLTDEIKRRRIKRISKIAFVVTTVNPDLLNILPVGSKFIPYCHIEVRNQEKRPTTNLRDCLRVLHAPSHRAAKGSDFIIETIENLQRDGHDIELKLLENMSHEAIGDEIHNCDLLIDQMYAGWYGGIAVEALCRGKPVMTYLRESDLALIDTPMLNEMPFININRKNLRSEILKFIEASDDSRKARQLASLSFALNWHDRHEIARMYKKFYSA